MKKKSLLFLLLFALLVPWAANAQTTVTIGDGTATCNTNPIGTYYNYSITEQLYTAEEIGMAGTISSISFYYLGIAAKDLPITVYMANVDAADLSTGGISLADADEVFSGTLSVPATAGWVTINLGTPFAYDGTSNLLIGFIKDYLYYFSGQSWQGTATTSYMARYTQSDSAGPYTTSTVPGSAQTNRPNIQMVITAGSGPTCEKPESIEATNVTTNAATVAWAGGSGIYNLEHKLASESWDNAEIIPNLTVTSYNFTELQPATTYDVRVQSVCGDATSGWRNTSFTTACGAITNFPWTETFESYATGNFEDPCWVNEHIEGGGSNIFKVYTSTSGMGGNTTHMLQLPDQVAGTMTKLVLPEMTLPVNYEFSIDVYRSSNTYQTNPYELEGIYVYASTDGEIEGATELAFIPRHYQVSSDVIPAEATTGWYTYEIPIGMSGTCYIILKGVNQYCTAIYMDNFAVKPMPTCPKPTGLAVTQNSIYAHGATITWTENGEASEWIVEYATDDEFTDVQSETANDNPTYTFQGLDPETTYYVRVKAHCGPDDESEYSNTVHFTTTVACPAPTGLTVNPGNYSAEVNWNGTSDNYIVSYRTAAYAEGLFEHFDASTLPSGWTRYTGLVDYVLTDSIQLTSTTSGWGTNSNALGQYNMKVNIYGLSCKYWLVTPEFTVNQDLNFDLALTDYNNSDPIEDPTAQADDRFVVLIYTNDAWHILREWNNSGSSYVYNTISTTGENVTIGLSAYYGQDVKIAFYGESTASGGDNDLHIDNVICGIQYEAGEWQTITVSDTTATITGLTPETDYEVKVQGDCGIEGLSLETSIVSFTTLEGCPVPQNVEVDDITHNSATVNWDGYNDSYIVSYRMAAHADGIIEHFDASGVPSGWTRYSGLVDGVVADTVELTSTTSGWGTTSYALGQHNMKVNIYGTTCKYWLVSPEFRPSQDLNFDLALTDYNNSDPIENNTLQSDDRFVVLIYADDAWHILREWNNSGSEYVYNTISTTGENVTINLSAYYGQKVKIAFYGESTNPTGMANTGGDNDLHIDNIVCGIPVEAGEWETVAATESPVILTGLTPETPYEVKLQGFCDGEPTEETEIVTFTTLEGCPVPQNVEVDDITNNSATVNWDGYSDSYIVSYRMAAHKMANTGGDNDLHIDNVICGIPYKAGEWQTVNVDEATATITGLTPETDYEVKVQGDCGIDGLSLETSIVSFTTLEVCPVPQNVEVDDITHNSATVNWEGYSDSYIVSYRMAAHKMANTGGDNDLHIDNVICGIPYKAGEWQTVNVDEATATITGLTPETDYEVKVQGFCDGEPTEWSEIVTFTTLEPQTTYTFAKEIIGYGNPEENPGGYYLIASPIGYVNPEHVGQMTGTPFDLYRFNQENEDEWENYKTECFDLEPGKGYLYANSEDVTLTFIGQPIQTEIEPFVLSREEGSDWAGWNLVGNPYAEAAYIQGVNGEAVSFYTLNADGSKLVPVESFTRIEPMEGVFVYAENQYEVLEFTTEEHDKGSLMTLNLSNNNGLVDRAMVRFDQCRQLPKFQLWKNSTKLYIPMDGEDYAVVRSEEIGEMPVSFKTEENGTYTLSLSNENVEFAYLHLIDNKTGNDVDLLETPSYTFEARTTDYANRFKLVFATGDNSNSDNFAFFSNGSFVINNDGNATLQVIDVNGRILKNESINGCANVNVNAAPGVYMIRLINGDNVKVQKVVVR